MGLFMSFAALVAQPASAEVKPQMSKFQVLMTELSPYLMNEVEYRKTENKEKVLDILSRINQNIDLLKHDQSVKDPSMKFRFQTLSEGFKDVSESYKNGFLDYSYWSLKSQVHQCSACHTEKQLAERDFKYDLTKSADPYEQAEFLYMIRNYGEAIPKYIELVKGYPKNKLTENHLGQSIKKIGYYHIRILKDDATTLKVFKEIQANKNLPAYLHRNLSKWINYLEIKKFRLLPESADDQTVKTMKTFVKDRDGIASHFGLGDDRFVIDQETLIYLHRVLDQNKNQELTPWLYLWIADIQNNYRDSLFDNTGELYLKECVKSFPKSKAVPECKKALKLLNGEEKKKK